MIEPVKNNLINQFTNASGHSAANKNSKPVENEPVISEVSCKEVLTTAVEFKGDSDAVEKARKLIADGQLDSPEAIRKAAENILKFGF